MGLRIKCGDMTTTYLYNGKDWTTRYIQRGKAQCFVIKENFGGFFGATHIHCYDGKKIMYEFLNCIKSNELFEECIKSMSK